MILYNNSLNNSLNNLLNNTINLDIVNTILIAFSFLFFFYLSGITILLMYYINKIREKKIIKLVVPHFFYIIIYIFESFVNLYLLKTINIYLLNFNKIYINNIIVILYSLNYVLINFYFGLNIIITILTIIFSIKKKNVIDISLFKSLFVIIFSIYNLVIWFLNLVLFYFIKNKYSKNELYTKFENNIYNIIVFNYVIIGIMNIFKSLSINIYNKYKKDLSISYINLENVTTELPDNINRNNVIQINNYLDDNLNIRLLNDIKTETNTDTNTETNTDTNTETEVYRISNIEEIEDLENIERLERTEINRSTEETDFMNRYNIAIESALLVTCNIFELYIGLTFTFIFLIGFILNINFIDTLNGEYFGFINTLFSILCLILFTIYLIINYISLKIYKLLKNNYCKIYCNLCRIIIKKIFIILCILLIVVKTSSFMLVYSYVNFLSNIKNFNYNKLINKSFVDDITIENLNNINNISLNYFNQF